MQLQSNFEALCSKLQHLLNVYRCQVTNPLNFFIQLKQDWETATLVWDWYNLSLQMLYSHEFGLSFLMEVAK